MRSIPILVAGAGASGMLAAITAARQGAKVLVIEKNNRPGKKLLATGNGRCNYTNRVQQPECYRCSQLDYPETVLRYFDADTTVEWFRELGILPKDRDGYIYPLSGQATSVRNVLERTMSQDRNITLQCEEVITDIIPRYEVSGMTKTAGQHTSDSIGEKHKITGYEVHTDRGKYMARCLILAMGGAAAPAQGTTGDAYSILSAMGIQLINPLPALTSVELNERCCKEWAGVRIHGQVSLWRDEVLIGKESGEIQMVAQGISGIPVFQLSGIVSRQIDTGNVPVFTLDCLPDFSEEELKQELMRRVDFLRESGSLGDVLEGMLPDKLSSALLKDIQLKKDKPASLLQKEELCENLITQIKNKVLRIKRVSGFEKAQVTSGGVDTRQFLPETVELQSYPGLYITGELADVDGICGGYNLQWAWSSGHLAGMQAAERVVG
ncbi:MAG: aminoacetone oxidase family FAD-binding enzyme [Lachnospiraceae bacterium]|nr:aminoacetone oxidase family FAD-binding enzyme [Lachnospiraceae bacterium]